LSVADADKGESKMYVMINDESYAVDSVDEVDLALDAMAQAGFAELDVFSGEPDGLGDSHRSGQKLLLHDAGRSAAALLG
jgi:hypothetical protein